MGSRGEPGLAAGQGRRLGYWKSSLNMAHPDAGMDEEPNDEVRLLLNMFPRLARAKLSRVSMISFFICSSRYQASGSGPAPTGLFPYSGGIRGPYDPFTTML